MKIRMLAAAATFVVLVAPVAAQAASPCGDAQMVTSRVSKLTPKGTAAGLAAALAAHKAWYAKAGLKDMFTMGPVLVGDKPSTSEFASLHVHGAAPGKHDAAWDAYVAQYRANSTITSEATYCLPKGAMLAIK
jgi:hypothetical protein